MEAPKGILDMQILRDLYCQRCIEFKDETITLFRIVFDKGVVNASMQDHLPDLSNTSGIFCLSHGCDSGYMALVQATKSITWNWSKKRGIN